MRRAITVGSAVLFAMLVALLVHRTTASSPLGPTTTQPSHARVDPSGAPGPQVSDPAAGPYPWPIPVGEDRACPAPKEPLVPPRLLGRAPGHGSRVLVIGDSLTRETRRARPGVSSAQMISSLEASGWTPTVVCFGGKGVAWGTQQVALLDAHGMLKSRVVVSLGTNDLLLAHESPAQFRARVDDFLAQIQLASAGEGVATHVWWLNLWAQLSAAKALHDVNPDYDDMSRFRSYNAVLADVCIAERGCTVIDWASTLDTAARQRRLGSLLDPGQKGGIHLTMAGSAARANLIVAALAHESPGGSGSAPLAADDPAASSRPAGNGP